jgi:diguanylate cyclase (GGDEF)-like protein
MDKVTKQQASKGAEEILLTQIKQEFTTPADAISEYLELVHKSVTEMNISVEDEINQIRSGCDRLTSQYEEAFHQFTGVNATKEKKSPEEYSELRHNLRTPLNAIIGYSEILIEDLEDDLDEQSLSDLQTIIDLSREIEKAIESFVDYIRGDITKYNDGSNNQLESAEALFKSLGDIDYTVELDEKLLGADILIVDDNVTNCEVLERRLSLQGLKCRTAYDGTTAIQEVNSKAPDLILLDVILPDINGLELLKTFRENHSSDAMPIIMVSAFNDVDGIAKCIQLGAQDYLPKPLNGTILLAKVVSSLERKFFREREKELVNKLHVQATTDQLTGISNRRVVFESLEDAYAQLLKQEIENFSVIMMDIDHFKNVNDTYGHSGGDKVLIAMAQTLDELIKEPNILGRIGGEEFLAVILDKEVDDMSEFCDKLRVSIAKNTVNYEEHSIKITTSGGVAHSSESENSSDLINKADERLYDAKKAGRDVFILE